MATRVFCCSSVEPYRTTRTDHDQKFESFLAWALVSLPTGSLDDGADLKSNKYAIQVVKQVNFGPLESKRYFSPLAAVGSITYAEITERDIIKANFKKVNSFKNFKCMHHNRFFELNLYKKDPVQKHHWRADVARPAGDIDL